MSTALSLYTLALLVQVGLRGSVRSRHVRAGTCTICLAGTHTGACWPCTLHPEGVLCCW